MSEETGPADGPQADSRGENPAVVLGSGVLGHTSFERHTDRYGAVHLTVLDSIPGEPAPARTVPVPGNDLRARIIQALAEAQGDETAAAAARQAIARTPADRTVAFDHAPLGATGTLVARVIHSNATDRDREFGKRHPELRPPETGERVVLGSGTLFTEQYGEAQAQVIGVRPDDGRAENWMDPNAIFRCKDHLVRLEFEIPQDSVAAAGDAHLLQADRRQDARQPASGAAQHGFPAANPLAQPGRMTSTGPRTAAPRTGTPPQSRKGPHR